MSWRETAAVHKPGIYSEANEYDTLPIFQGFTYKE